MDHCCNLCGYDPADVTTTHRCADENQRTRYVNLSPHVVRMTDGTEYWPDGLARCKAKYSTPDHNSVMDVVFGEIVGLPDPRPGTIFIVSGMVRSALGVARHDVVAPATGHPLTIRKDGQIWSVPGFIR